MKKSARLKEHMQNIPHERHAAKERWTSDEEFKRLLKLISEGFPATEWITLCPALKHPFAEREVSDLKGIPLGSRRIGAMDLSDSFLNGSSFVASELEGTEFQWSLLSDASFVGAHLRVVQMSPVFGERVDFSGAELRQVFASESRLTDSTFDRATLDAVDFSGADLSRTSFVNAIAKGCRFDHGSLEGADFSNAELVDCNLRRSTPIAGRFTGTTLRSCDMRGADFRFADFTGAQFVGGKFGVIENNGKFFPTRFDDTPQMRRLVAISQIAGSDEIEWSPASHSKYFSGRAKAGDPCSRTGWWRTLAMVGSRRYFKEGEVMPLIEDSDYGSTIWQWDSDQSAPKL